MLKVKFKLSYNKKYHTLQNRGVFVFKVNIDKLKGLKLASYLSPNINSYKRYNAI